MCLQSTHVLRCYCFLSLSLSLSLSLVTGWPQSLVERSQSVGSLSQPLSHINKYSHLDWAGQCSLKLLEIVSTRCPPWHPFAPTTTVAATENVPHCWYQDTRKHVDSKCGNLLGGLSCIQRPSVTSQLAVDQSSWGCALQRQVSPQVGRHNSPLLQGGII